MSREATDWAWGTECEHGARLVLLALARCHNEETAQCNPNVATLCRMTRLGKTAVVQSIEALEKSGLVKVGRKSGCGSNYELAFSNRFEIRTGSETEPVRNPVLTGSETEPNRFGIRPRNRERTQRKGSTSPWHVEFGIELPASLQSQQCLDAVRTWLGYKRERRESYKETGLRAAVTKWSREFTAESFPVAVEASMANGWKGLFPPKTEAVKSGNGRCADVDFWEALS